MSLNDLKLSPQTLVALYSSSLVERLAEEKVNSQSPKYLGKNQKNILILVSNESIAYLNETDLELLTTILSACKLNLADVAIINFKNISIQELQTGMELLVPKYILLFGTEPLLTGLPINFPAFQLQQFNGSTYLFSPELSKIGTDKILKAKLWTSLKLLFNL